MKRTNTYEAPMTEVVELYAEAAFLESSLIGSGAGDDLPVEEWGDAFQSL